MGMIRNEADVLETFLQTERRRLLSFARRYVGGDAQDALQAASFYAFRARHRLDTTYDIYPWFTQILWRACRRIHLKKQAQARLEREIHQRGQKETPALETSVAIRIAIQSLTPCERSAMTSVYLEGLSVCEAATQAKCSDTAMRVRLYRGRRRVSVALGGPQ